MGTTVIQISLHFKTTAISLLWSKGNWEIDGLTIRLLEPHDLLVEHGRRRAFLHLLRVIRVPHILGLNNNVVMLVELVFEITSDPPNCHLGLRSTLN